MSSSPFIDHPPAFDALRQAEHRDCDCALRPCEGWSSITEAQWSQASLTAQATLRDPHIDEPTFEELHPQGTRYESANAPVALKFFPYNRCDVFACQRCAQTVLRYTEFGGYYVDHRARRITRDTPLLD
jgi:hypothetical protein